MKTSYLKKPMKLVCIAMLFVFLIASRSNGQMTKSETFSDSELEISETTLKDGSEYCRVTYDNLQYLGEIGKPELPVKYVKLLIPATESVSGITLTKKSIRKIDLVKKVIPAQPCLPISDDQPPQEFSQPNELIYNSDKPFPEDNVQLANEGYFDGNHIITLAIYPVIYYPKLNYIELSSTIEFEIIFKPNSRINKAVKYRSERNQKIYDVILNDLVDNPEDISIYSATPSLGKKSQIQTDQPSFYEYVIITSSELVPYFGTFVEWKKRKGLDIGVVTTSDIYSYYPDGDQIIGLGIDDNAGSIRQYLSDAYQSGTVWVLLAGDENVVPVRTGNAYIDGYPGHYANDPGYWRNLATDLYFADFDGDWNVDIEDPVIYGEKDRGTIEDDAPDYYPEIWVGRLPCNCEQDISNWTEKILVYEQDPGKGDASYLMNSFWIEGAETYNSLDITKTYYPSSISHTIWYKSTLHDGSEVVEKMGDEYGILNWYCHGAPNSFRTKPDSYPRKRVFAQDDYCSYDSCSDETGDGLDWMINKDKYPIVYSICCTVGAYDYPYSNCPGRSMVEGFTVMYEHNCGPAILANTRAGWMSYWGGGPSETLHRSWCGLIKQGTNDPIYSGYLHIGVAEATSKANNHSGDDCYHYINYSHNLFGCPETRIWTATPSTMSSASVTVNSSNIVVNAGVSGCDICVSSGNNGSSYYLAVSDVQSYTFSTSVRPLYITITKPNYIPYTAVTGGTFTTAETWFGNLHVLGTVAVTGSGSLTILPGTKVTMDGYYALGFYDSARLIAEGTADNPILFTSTNGTSRQSWNRLYFRSSNNILKNCEVEYGDWALAYYGYPSTGNIIENCIIHDNDQGIRVERSGFDIKNCEIYDNRHNVVTINNTQVDIEGTKIYDGGRDGIYSLSNNTLNLYGSVIENNGNGGTSSRNGIYTGYNDVINIGDFNETWDGYNTIRNNYSSEVFAYSASQVQVLCNSIHDDDGYEVYNLTGNSILGLFNWWGESPPNSSQFYGNVIYLDEFESQPDWEGQTRSGQLSKSRAMLANYISPEENIANLKNLIASNSRADQADSALQSLYAIVRSDYVKDQYYERDGFYAYLSNLYESFENYPLGKRALQYMITWKMLSGEIKTAIELSLKALDCLSDSDRMGVMGNLINLYAYNNQFDEASEILTRFKKESASNEVDLEFLTASLKDKIAMYEEEKVLAKGSTPPQEESASLLPEKFKLYKAFPNPFNPKTKISFDLPEAAKIEIVVYDLMGHEVWKSAKTHYSAGTYSVIWNGVNHSGQPVGTGMYLVRLNSAKYNATQKVLLMK